jgi:hypothetical protein
LVLCVGVGVGVCLWITVNLALDSALGRRGLARAVAGADMQAAPSSPDQPYGLTGFSSTNDDDISLSLSVCVRVIGRPATNGLGRQTRSEIRTPPPSRDIGASVRRGAYGRRSRAPRHTDSDAAQARLGNVIWCDMDMGVPGRAAGASRGGSQRERERERERERGATPVHVGWPAYMATHCLGFGGGVHTEPGGHVCCVERCGACCCAVLCVCREDDACVCLLPGGWLAMALFMVF